MMNEDKVKFFHVRIDSLNANHVPSFGKMNAHQMICHCTDQIRMALGEKRSTEYGVVDGNEIRALARAGKPVATPKGFGQVEGEGTPPTEFESDKKTLKGYILRFATLPDGFPYPEHPFFGHTNKDQWHALVAYHLDHHLKQFGV